jgi:dsRNA-specific ribonuclease
MSQSIKSNFEVNNENYTFIRFPNYNKNIVKELYENAKVHDIYTSNKKEFKDFFKTLLKTRGGMTDESIEKILDEDGLKQLKVAFTHSSFITEVENLELYEILGDVTVNKCIIWYIYRHIIDLKDNPKAVMLVDQLKKKYASKKTLSFFSRKLNFQSYIRWKELPYVEIKSEKQIKYTVLDDSVYEDVFEAFCAALENIIDLKLHISVGYSVVYNIIASLMNEIHIETDISQLVDFKTQLKEINDIRKTKYSDKPLIYESIKSNDLKWKVKLTLTFLKKNNPIIQSTEGGSRTGVYSYNENDKEITIEFLSKDYLRTFEGDQDASNQALNWFKTHCNISWLYKEKI